MNRDYTKLIGLMDEKLSDEHLIKLMEDKEKEFYQNEINIKNPKHYKLDGLEIESIDIIKSLLGKEGFKNFCYGNVIKYIIRAKKKNGDEDFKKAKVYLEWYLEV